MRPVPFFHSINFGKTVSRTWWRLCLMQPCSEHNQKSITYPQGSCVESQAQRAKLCPQFLHPCNIEQKSVHKLTSSYGAITLSQPPSYKREKETELRQNKASLPPWASNCTLPKLIALRDKTSPRLASKEPMRHNQCIYQT